MRYMALFLAVSLGIASCATCQPNPPPPPPSDAGMGAEGPPTPEKDVVLPDVAPEDVVVPIVDK